MDRTITPDALNPLLAGEAPPVLPDVRRAEDRAKEPPTIPGAAWKRPAAVADWLPALAPDREVVLYGVRGGSVSNSVPDTLLAQGLKARCIEGALEGRKAAGGSLVPQP